jgi:hypothetical protein
MAGSPFGQASGGWRDSRPERREAAHDRCGSAKNRTSGLQLQAWPSKMRQSSSWYSTTCRTPGFSGSSGPTSGRCSMYSLTKRLRLAIDAVRRRSCRLLIALFPFVLSTCRRCPLRARVRNARTGCPLVRRGPDFLSVTRAQGTLSTSWSRASLHHAGDDLALPLPAFLLGARPLRVLDVDGGVDDPVRRG